MTEFQKADIEKLAECVAERILAFLDASKESTADDSLVDISGALKILGVSRSQFYRLLAKTPSLP